MKERPILFSSPMVRAILDGRKTQTRRVVKHVPMLGDPLAWCAAAVAQEPGWVNIVGDYKRFCPHGQPGDRIWVRETWRAFQPQPERLGGSGPLAGAMMRVYDENPKQGHSIIEYKADFDSKKHFGGARPSIHMPRWVSRINLEIVSVRVERLQEISEEDAKMEGCDFPSGGPTSCYRVAFQKLWDSINDKRGFGWTANPWVWVIEFRRIK